MLRKTLKWRVPVLVLLLGLVAALPTFAGSAVIGSVAGSMNATVGGQTLLPNTALFSGDSLQVKDGVAVVAMGNGSRMVFGRDTVASFLRDTNEVTVLLSQGLVSVYHPEGSAAMRVKVGDISVLPVVGFKTLGEVAMLNGTVVVTTKEGSMRVENSGQTVDVARGKTIAIPAKTARAPQGGAAAAGGAAGGAHMSASTALSIAGLAASGTSTVTSGVAVSRAGGAKDAATMASSTATGAAAAANSAASAAAAAQSSVAAAGTAFTNLCTAISTVNPGAITSCS
jgi:hypothetical protein